MLNYTITLSLLITAIILFRAVFRKKVPQRLVYALWLVVIIKMCLPFSVISLDIPALPELGFSTLESVTVETTTVFETEIKDSTPVTQPTVTQPPQVTEKPISTAPHTTASPAVTAPPEVTADVQKPIITAPSVTKAPDVSRPAPAHPKANAFDLGKTLLTLSALGSIIVGSFFSLSAVLFSSKLREDRIFVRKEGRISVYLSQNARTPCVFGLIPKIYLTPIAAESENLDLILRHELIHIRHGDSLWAIVRTAAVTLFWWNPLVWAAAILSRRDAELACDEAVASSLDRSERSTYAHTIIDQIPQKAGGALGLSSAPIKERMIMIMKKNKTSTLCIVLALVLTLSAAGCSFIGAKPQIDGDTTVPQDTTKPNDTTEPDDDTYDNTNEIYFEYITPNSVEFTFGDGVIDVSAFEYSSTIAYKEINEEYLLIPVYKSEYKDGDIRFWDITVHILNRKTGEIVHTENLEDGAVPTNVVKTTENGAIVNSARYLDGEITSWEIKREDDKFTITEVPYNQDYYIEPGVPDVLTSPDGKTKVYNIGPKDYITVKDDAGMERIVLVTYLADEKIETSVKGYVAVDFIDNDRFVYRILGWEWSYGYGVYNVKTGEKVEYENEYKPLAAYNGKVYSVLNKNYEFGNKIAILDEDGVHTEISVPSKYTEIFERMKNGHNPERYPVFHEGKWFVIDVVNQSAYAFSDDLSEMVAEIKLPWDRKLRDASFSGGRLLLFFDKAIGPFVDVEDSPTDPATVTSYFGEVSGSPIEYVFGKEAAGIEVSLLERSGYVSSVKIDKEHYLFCAFERAENPETDIAEYVNITAYVINIKTGEIVQTEQLEDGDVPGGTVKIMENGVVVDSFPNADGEVTTSWEIKREGEKFTFTKVPYNRYYDMIENIDDYFTSPDGKTTVYNIGSKNHVSVRGEDGVKRAVLQTHLTEPGNELTVVGYTAIGFLDNDRFVYRIGGWEWTYGYGIYNVKTGETVEYRNGFAPQAIYNGKVYSALYTSYEFYDKIEILDENGVRTEISVPEQYSSMVSSPFFFEGKWIELNYNPEGGKLRGIYVFSDDFSTLLAEIKLTEERYLEDIFFADGRITLVLYKED